MAIDANLPEPSAAGGILEVDLGAIAANWRSLGGLHGSGAVAGVVKADAYGLGAAKVVPALYAAGCRHFFVAHLQEAVAVRGLIGSLSSVSSLPPPPSLSPEGERGMVAVLNGLLPGTEAEYVAQGLMPVLGSLAEIDAWAAQGRRVGRVLPAMVQIDTGMSRLGLDAPGLAALREDPSRLDGITVTYWMTHLVAAEMADDPINEIQRHRFAAACAGLPAAKRSLSNSSGIFLGAGFGSDLARPGAALYGINPTPAAANPMRPAVRLRVRVLAVRDVPAGAQVGYNGIWTAPRPSRIATAAIGYADGWHRSHSNRGHAIFDGRPVPLVGRVSMDLTTFDVTDHPAIAPGAWLELIGPGSPVDDVAAAAGTNGYEVLTSFGRRFARIYAS